VNDNLFFRYVSAHAQIQYPLFGDHTRDALGRQTSPGRWIFLKGRRLSGAGNPATSIGITSIESQSQFIKRGMSRKKMVQLLLELRQRGLFGQKKTMRGASTIRSAKTGPENARPHLYQRLCPSMLPPLHVDDIPDRSQVTHAT